MLRMILEHQPEHLWMAPECLPWSSWNKFNRNLSSRHWMDIHGKPQESREHLLFCSLLLKVQREHGRHAHMERPDSSGAWSQPELETLVQNTILARFDQCQMGLKHPQNHRFTRKGTAVHMKFTPCWMNESAEASPSMPRLPDFVSFVAKPCRCPDLQLTILAVLPSALLDALSNRITLW